MKKIGLIVVLLITLGIILKIVDITHTSPEKVLDIVKHWSIAWLKGGCISGIVVIIIFTINKYLSDERQMSIVGSIVLTILIPLLLTLFFGFHLKLLIFGIASGIILGYFSYIIDDHLLEIWRLRHVTLPIFIGLGFGGSVIIACVVENWQDEFVHIADHAVCTEGTVERYTYHSREKNSYYSWDYHKSYYFFNRGETYPAPKEGIDYTLGTGALFSKDRIKFTHHKWIGGNKLTKQGDDKGFKWIYLNDVNLQYDKGIVCEVEENFFGHAIKNGKITSIPYAPRSNNTQIVLPREDDVPGAIMLTFQFVKIMASNPDFALLRWIYLLVYLPFLVLAIFIPQIRGSFLIFFASSTIIILILLAILARKMGENISDVADSFSFGGGSSGGGGAGSNW